DIAARTSNGWTPLHIAVWDDFDHSDVVRLLLDSGADIQDRELRHGRTPLHLASASGLVQSIHLLCARGAKKEGQDDRGRTPLYYAAYCASEEGVRTLLELGADATTRAYDGTTPLDEIGQWEDADKDPSRDQRIRAMLLRAGATVSAAEDTAPASQSEGGQDDEGD
ncbi:ankyrin, partial [Schizophyllum commune Tattone D]